MAIPKTKYKDIQFSTLFRYEHIVGKGHATFSVSNQSVNIPHGLPYIPYAQLFLEYPAGHITQATNSAYNDIDVQYNIDATNISITVFANNDDFPGGGVNVYYRIYAEPLV